MFTLKKYQEKAVLNLLEESFQCLSSPFRRESLLLKAPTGSGKTVMMASFISRLVEEVRLQPNLPANVAFIWLAPNTLHLQSYESLRNFYSTLQDLRTFRLSDLQINDLYLEHKDLLFVNWSSLDKDKNTFRQDNERSFNLESLLVNTKAKGTELIVIIDEAHLSAFTGKQAKKVLAMLNAKLEVSVTATPLLIPNRNVIIHRQEVVAEEMIKKGAIMNPKLKASKQNESGSTLDIYLLEEALQKRESIRKKYEELGIPINPLLLIQLPSENKALSKEDVSKRNYISHYLEESHGISEKNGGLAVWLSDSKDKVNLEGIENPNASQKVLIFKQAIAQGWDCPRASVLLIFREYGNFNFGVQTVGRILRMPEQRHYDEDLLDFGYIYTNVQNDLIKIVADDLDYFNLQIGTRQSDLSYPSLLSSYVKNDRSAKGYLTIRFYDVFYQVVEKRYGVEQIPETTVMSSSAEGEKSVAIRERNRAIFRKNGWHLESEDVSIDVPTDLHIDQYEVNSIYQVQDSIEHFGRTQVELSAMVDRFCYRVITRLNRSKSWKVMRTALIQFVEYYLGYDEYRFRKILLNPYNQPMLKELITSALENFDTWQKERGNEMRQLASASWEVPLERIYAETHDKHPNILSHALLPYYELRSASTPERKFAVFLEHHKEHIFWWYKNGDKGKEHFAITYKNLQNRESLFYVDFIVYLKNGQIALFDTKTRGSDVEAVQKHNALLEYAELQSPKRSKKLLGSIVIVEEQHGDYLFRYCQNRITDTHDLRGWGFVRDLF
ncbi:MAG: DEAD/DEAH box helicase family protein [Bernardetiaceae bacterium]|nr:DEAD/DEAH box helicase family protein [Bernardetiaceae bacterium]